MSATRLSLIVIAGLLLGAAVVQLTSGAEAPPLRAEAIDPVVREAALRSTPPSERVSNEISNAPASASVLPRYAEPGIRLANGRVTAHLRNASLSAAVETIARGSTVELDGVHDLDGIITSMDFDDLPLAEALLRLTTGHDSWFRYGPAEHGATRLASLSIHRGSVVEAGSAPRPLDAPLQQLDDTDPQQRADAIETIAERGGELARLALLRALGDADETVRLRALEQTQTAPGLAMPVDVLRNMVQQDVSESVRFKVLDVLATDPRIDAATLVAIARAVESDASELVRSKATELRQQVETAQRPASD